MKIIFICLLAYIIGTLSGSYYIGNKFLNTDIRNHGSGNAGTTNAMRVLGKKWGVITFIIDFIKGSLVTVLAKYIFKLDDFLTLVVILCCIIGHDFPFYMKFKGGKGVATTMGALALLNFKLTFIAWAIWMIVAIFSKMASLASIAFFVAFAILFTISGKYELNSLLMIYTMAILGIVRHKANIKRILNGSENKLGKVNK